MFRIRGARALLIGVVFAASGASNAAAAPNHPSTASQLQVGVPYSSTINRDTASSEWLRIPATMRPGDSMTITSDSSASSIRYCLVPPIDDFGQTDAQNDCDGPGYTSSYPHVDVDLGKFRRWLTWTAPTAQGFILVQPGCGFCGHKTWTYSLTVEQMVTAVNIGAPLLTKSARAISLLAGATLGDNSPAPDGIPGRLTWGIGEGAPQPLAQATTMSGGRLQFNAVLPPEAAGRKIELTACVDQIGGDAPKCTTQTVAIDADPKPPAPIDVDKDGVSPPADCNDANSSIRPGLPEVIDNAVDEDCNGVALRRARYATRISLTRKGSRYSGRVVSAAPSSLTGCSSRRVVKLRRVGSGTTSFGSVVTNARGRFTVRRSSRLRGRVYAVAAAKNIGSVNVCNFSKSRTIR